MAYRNGKALQIGGLLTVLVDIDSAVETAPGLKTVCKGTGTPHVATALKQHLTCPNCGNEDPTFFEKASVDGGEFLVVGQDEVSQAREAAVGTTKDLISLTPHPTAQVRESTIMGKGVYYLMPHKPAYAPLYGLFVDTLKRRPEVAWLALWTPATKPNLYEVRLFGDTLVMEERARTETLKVAQVARDEDSVTDGFRSQVDMLISATESPYDPAKYVDQYAAQMLELLATKQAEVGVLGEAKAGARPLALAPVIDLAAALAASLSAAGVTAPAPKKRAPRKPKAA